MSKLAVLASRDATTSSSSETDACRLLPVEVWSLIFRLLSDYHLCRSVIPVCHLFRECALSLLFRRLDDDDGVNLGQDWMLWHNDVPFELLRRCGRSPRCLSFSVGRELALVDRSCDLQLGLYGDPSFVETFPDRSSRFLEERRSMVETIGQFPDIESLKILETFSGVESHSIPPRIDFWIDVRFLEDALSPCRHNLKELELDLRCYWEQDPVLTRAHIDAIGECATLTSLTLHNRLPDDALPIIAGALANLEKLHLMDCSEILLVEFGSLIGEGSLLKLTSLRLMGLDCSLPRDTFKDFLGGNPELCTRLKCLGIECFSQTVDGDPTQFAKCPIALDLDQALRSCDNLEELQLAVCGESAPDFGSLRHLRSLRYLNLMPKNTPLGSPHKPSSIALNQLAALFHLEISIYDLAPLCRSDKDLRRCLGGLHSLYLMETDYVDHTFQYVSRVLSVCRRSLRSLQIDRLRGAQPLRDIDELDFQFTRLDVDVGGEILFKNLPAPNLRHLVRFKYGIPKPWHPRDRSDGAAAVRFIGGVCDASATTLRHLDIHGHTYIPMEEMGFVSKLKKLENLRLFVHVTGEELASVLRKFVRECNRLFPVDTRDCAAASCPDELFAFPAMKDFEVIGYLDCRGFAKVHYAIRKTCFGQVKRFLGLVGKFSLPVEMATVMTARFVELHPIDALLDRVPDFSPDSCVSL